MSERRVGKADVNIDMSPRARSWLLAILPLVHDIVELKSVRWHTTVPRDFVGVVFLYWDYQKQ